MRRANMQKASIVENLSYDPVRARDDRFLVPASPPMINRAEDGAEDAATTSMAGEPTSAYVSQMSSGSDSVVVEVAARPLVNGGDTPRSFARGFARVR
jgi:hypothetical protein